MKRVLDEVAMKEEIKDFLMMEKRSKMSGASESSQVAKQFFVADHFERWIIMVIVFIPMFK